MIPRLHQVSIGLGSKSVRTISLTNTLGNIIFVVCIPYPDFLRASAPATPTAPTFTAFNPRAPEI